MAGEYDQKPAAGATEEAETAGEEEHVSIAAPMTFWIVLLILGLVFKTLAYFSILVTQGTTVYTTLLSVANFILFPPGSIILPLIIGAVIGSSVGLKSKKIAGAQKSGLLNGIYAAVIYVVAIVVIYEIMVYVLPNSAPQLGFLFSYWLAAPVLTVVALSFIFAVLSHSRKVH